MTGPIIPPIKADDDPFEEEQQDDLFLEETPATLTDVAATMYDAPPPGVPIDRVPLIPTSALDPMPPKLEDKIPLDVAKTRAYYMQRDLDRAAKPLLEQLGPSFERLSTFGYSEPTTDPGSAKLRPILRKLVRNI